MRIVDQFYQLPGRCFFSRSSSVEKPILDTDLNVVGEGRVYIGGEWLEEACRLIGWTPPETLELAIADRDDAIRRAEGLEAQLQSQVELEQAILDAAAKIRRPAPAPAPVFPFSQS